jgi:hypothetical protein
MARKSTLVLFVMLALTCAMAGFSSLGGEQ